jgi:hypothetical protein
MDRISHFVKFNDNAKERQMRLVGASGCYVSPNKKMNGGATVGMKEQLRSSKTLKGPREFN